MPTGCLDSYRIDRMVSTAYWDVLTHGATEISTALEVSFSMVLLGDLACIYRATKILWGGLLKRST